MRNISLSMACGFYDRTEPLRDGSVQVEGIDLTYIGIESPPEIFARMIKGQEFDIAEMSLATYFTARALGSFPFLAIPVFPVRFFDMGTFL